MSHGLKGMMASVSLRQIHSREEIVFVNIGRMIILSKKCSWKGQCKLRNAYCWFIWSVAMQKLQIFHQNRKIMLQAVCVFSWWWQSDCLSSSCSTSPFILISWCMLSSIQFFIARCSYLFFFIFLFVCLKFEA